MRFLWGGETNVHRASVVANDGRWVWLSVGERVMAVDAQEGRLSASYRKIRQENSAHASLWYPQSGVFKVHGTSDLSVTLKDGRFLQIDPRTGKGTAHDSRPAIGHYEKGRLLCLGGMEKDPMFRANPRAGTFEGSWPGLEGVRVVGQRDGQRLRLRIASLQGGKAERVVFFLNGRRPLGWACSRLHGSKKHKLLFLIHRKLLDTPELFSAVDDTGAIRWSISLQEAYGQDQQGSPSYKPDLSYAQTLDGVVWLWMNRLHDVVHIGLDAGTGRVLWRYAFPGSSSANHSVGR